MISVIYRITDIDGDGKVIVERDYQHKDYTYMEEMMADAIMSGVEKVMKKIEKEHGE